MSTKIESRQNPRIKELQKLTKRRRRDERQVTLVEGNREVVRALASGIIPIEAYICDEHVAQDQSVDQAEMNAAINQLEALDASRHCHLFHISSDVYEKVAYRGESGGMLLVVPYQPLILDKLPLSENPFFVVVENVEKPGNLGAILRTADAAGADGIIVASSAGINGICISPSINNPGMDNPGAADPANQSPDQSPTDIHNPNAIRASLGTIFSIPLAQSTTQETIRWLRQHNISIVTTSPDSERLYANIDLTGPVAIVMGSEAYGISEAWFEAADFPVSIPMRGIGDSLNLSTSTAIMLYEVVRQRLIVG